MSKRRLYNFLKPGKVADEFECIICTELLFEPVKLSCDHVICEECIEKVTKKDSTCPMCRKKYNSKEVRKAEQIILNLNEVGVLCKFEHCDWSGPMKELELHEEGCIFSPKKCRKEVLDLLPKYDKAESCEVSSPCISLATQLFKSHPGVIANLLMSDQRSQEGKKESLKTRLAKTSDQYRTKLFNLLI